MPTRFRARRRLWLAIAATAALGVVPAAADVVSAGPDAVTVTVYRGEAQSAEDLRNAGEDDTTGLTPPRGRGGRYSGITLRWRL